MRRMRTLLGTAFLLCLLMVLAAIPVFGAEIVKSGPCGDDLTYTLDSDGLLTISGTGPMWDYGIEHDFEIIYDGYYSEEFYKSTAPWGLSDYTSLLVEPGVTTIGKYAFYGANAYDYVYDYSNDYTYFYYFSKLISVSLPEGLTSIGNYAFYDCTSLTSVIFPSTLEMIGDEAFSGCIDLTTVTFPKWSSGQMVIGLDAFYYCPNLIHFHLSDITSWLSLSGDTATLTTTTDSEEDFYEDYKEAIHLYLNDELITDLVIPEGVTHIRDNAFQVAKDLTSVTLPEGLTSIGSMPFYGCTTLTDFYIDTIDTWLSLPTNLMSVNDLEKNIYLQGELLTELVIPEGTTSIRGGAFRNYTRLTSVTFPKGLTSIGYSAFSNCDNLTSVTLPEGLTSIGYYAFYDCDSLSSVTLPEGLTSIGEEAFDDCDSLTSVTLPEGLTSIGEEAFDDCDSLTSVTLPEGLTSIGSGAFRNCGKLTTLKLAKGLGSIATDAFSGCIALTDFYIEDIDTWLSMPTDPDLLAVNGLSKRIYLQGELLTDLVIPEGATSIRANAFKNYTRLTSVSFPKGTESIGANAFLGCTGLKNVTFPQGMTNIDNDSFQGCTGLTSLIFLGEAPSIGSTAFPSLTLTVYHPEDASWTDSTKLNYGGTLTYKPLGTPSALQMTLSDTYPYYFTDDALSKEKMTTTLTYSSGAVSLLHPTQYELAADDMTTPGAKTVTISSDGLSTSYAIFVHDGHRVESIPQDWPESSHDHGNNADDIQTLHIPGANLIQITFDQRTSLEPWYDFLYVYDANDTQIARFTGTKAAGLTMTVPGDTVKLRLTSDATTADWGYALTDVSASWMEHIFTGDSGDCTICGNACAHTYADPTVTAAPWCEVTGERTYTCTQCGHCKTETIPALGHSYENGICSNCGAIDFEAATDPGLKLGYPTLSFEDEIVYNIYFYVTDPSDVAELGLMTLTTADRYATIEDATATVPGYVTNGTMYLVKTNGIPAAHMGDTLYFKVYAKLTDGSYAYSPLGGYNAKTYADTVLEGDYTDTMKSLVVSMLNYGAEAQRYFGHHTDALVDRSLTDAQKALVRPFDSTMVDPIVKLDPSKTEDFTRDASNFRTLYPSVSFDGAFAINLYCGPTVTVDDGMTLYWWDAETADTTDRLTLDNATGSAPMELVLTDWWGQLPGIAAKDISKTYYLTCVFTSEGRTVSTGILPYSLGKYCASKADADGDPQQAFAQATAVYGYYAKNYFTSIA